MTTEANNNENIPAENAEEKKSENAAAEETVKENAETGATEEVKEAEAKPDEETKQTEEAKPADDKKQGETKTERRPDSGHGQRREYTRRDSSQRFPKFRRKVCYFCTNKDAVIDYKDSGTLERFITDRGKILPRRVTGVCARHQRGLANAIKKARIIALVPFIEK